MAFVDMTGTKINMVAHRMRPVPYTLRALRHNPQSIHDKDDEVKGLIHTNKFIHSYCKSNLKC